MFLGGNMHKRVKEENLLEILAWQRTPSFLTSLKCICESLGTGILKPNDFED